LSYADANQNNQNPVALEIVEENNYYPFGLKHKGYNYNVNSTNLALKRKFGGKEMNDELGLNWYDFGARNYDASLGRWINADPVSEFYYDSSPYNYATNNPNIFIDPNGMWIVNIIGGYDSNGNYIYSLNFVAEEGDDLESLSTQLGISVDEILYAHPELKGTSISEGQSLGLGQISEVSAINDALNGVDKNQDNWNCADLAGGSNCSSIKSQWDNPSENNIENFAQELQSDYNSVTKGNTKVGSIIHFRLNKSKALSGAKKAAVNAFVQQMRAAGLPDAEIKRRLSDPKVQKDIDNYAQAIVTNERHFAVVILKTRDGKNIQNIIQKSGQLHFNLNDVDTMEDTQNIHPYEPTPVEGTKSPYYNRKF